MQRIEDSDHKNFDCNFTSFSATIKIIHCTALMSNRSQWIGIPLEISLNKVNHFIGFGRKCWHVLVYGVE